MALIEGERLWNFNERKIILENIKSVDEVIGFDDDELEVV